eukprot:TRINITY_DN11852_c0_g1_i1.p1 TRINITY_DN11852_c0_g1~~TRINITY_DN11852_c0_g1_i1.p1  ORF type:complete len:195 (-),score=34.54 TRINITY_DN11852_c0_g1_i1:22-606(-)
MTDTLIGLVGKDYVMILADRTQARSILRMKNGEDKITTIGNQKLLGMCGDCGDRVNFVEYIARNIQLNSLRTGLDLSTNAIATFTRNELAESLRKRPYQTNLLLGGVDDGVPSLFYLDYLGTLHKMNFGAHGYASNFVLSIFDRHYKEGLTVEEGLDIMKKCVQELRVRFLINQHDYIVKHVDANGVHETAVGI